MTSERIAELRQWCSSDSYDPPDADGILMVLDEREALLEALRSLFVLYRAKHGVGTSREEALTAAALARAEAP